MLCGSYAKQRTSDSCILMFFILFFHVVCEISNFNTWTAKHLDQASCNELTLLHTCPLRFSNLPTALSFNEDLLTFLFYVFLFFYSWKLSVKWPHQFPLLYVWQQQNRETEASYSDHSDVQWYSFGLFFFQSWISNIKFEPMQCERRISHGPLHEFHQYFTRVLTPVAGLLGKLPKYFLKNGKIDFLKNKKCLCSLCPRISVLKTLKVGIPSEKI